MSPSRVPTVLRSRRALIAIAAASIGFAATPASAAVISQKVTDPAGDSSGGTGLDITGATITHDNTKGTVSATVTFAAAPPKNAPIAIGLGKTVNGECSIGNEGDGSLAMIVLLEQNNGIWVLGSSGSPNSFTPSLSGSTVKATTAASSALKTFQWDCSVISAQQANDAGEAVGDTASGKGTTAGGQVVVLTDKPDADKDGVPDVADACPKVPGSSANGCLSIAAKLALRLGAKRVAVDTLVKRTGSTCKATAKAVVKDGKKTLGKANLVVGVHGSFCHISGVVKIKKPKKKKVKITISGSGFKKINKTVKR